MKINQDLNLGLWRSESITQISKKGEQTKSKTFWFIQVGTDYQIEYSSGKTVPIQSKNLRKWISQHSVVTFDSNQEENFRINIEMIVSKCIKSDTLVQEVSKFAEEAKELKNKSGHLWECVSRTPDKKGEGYRYRFKLKDEYNVNTNNQNKNAINRQNATNKINEIFPAVEQNFLNDDFDTLRRFGFKREFKEDDIFMELPDHKALTNRLKINGLGFVRIGQAKGVADDLSYIDAHEKFDTIFSENLEFIHDATIHVRPTILRALQSKIKFEESRESIKFLIAEKRKLFEKAQALVNNNVLKLDEESVALIQKHLDKMILTLSYLIDVRTSGNSNINLTTRAFEFQYIALWSLNDALSHYLIKRFGSEIKEQLFSILSLPEILDSLATVDDGYKQLKKFVQDKALEIEDDEIQKIAKICKAKMSLFIEHFDLFSQNLEEWATELEKSVNPSYFCEKARALQDMQLTPTQIREITNHERFRAIHEKNAGQYNLERIIHFCREEQQIADFLLISNPYDYEIGMFLITCRNYPHFLDSFQELRIAIAKTRDNKSFIQILKALKNHDLTPAQILEIQLLCKNNANCFQRAYAALNEACSPEKLAIFLSDLSEPETFIAIAKTLKEEKLTLEDIHSIQLNCGKNAKGFEEAYNISKGKMSAQEIAIDLSKFEDVESFIEAAKLFKASGSDPEKIKEFMVMCGENAKEFINACKTCFRYAPTPNYRDLLKILSQSNDRNFANNLIDFKNYQMFPDEILSIKERCPDFFHIYWFFKTKPPIEDLISAINESIDIKTLKKLANLKWKSLTLKDICKIQIECAKHDEEFIDELIVASEVFSIFNPPAYQDVIDALALSKDRKQYISLIRELKFDLFPSEILEIQNNPQTNNKDFIRTFGAFITPPIIQDLVDALNQSSDKQVFTQIAIALQSYSFQPDEILKIQEACGKNASKFPQVFKVFNMPPPIELANVVGKLTNDLHIEKFIQIAKDNKNKNLSPERLFVVSLTS